MTTFALPIGLAEPIGEWATLVQTVRAWTNRDDWTDTQITEFIALAEARFNRVLRVPEMEGIATATLGTGNNDLPSDFLAMRSLFLGNRELKAYSPVGLISQFGDYPGEVSGYAVLGANPRKIRLGPQPASTQAVTMVYYQKITPVDINNADNWLLNEHPDIYLIGTLLMAEAFLVNDERIPMWKAAFDEMLAELDNAGQRDRFGSGPLVPPSVPQVSGVRA